MRDQFFPVRQRQAQEETQRVSHGKIRQLRYIQVAHSDAQHVRAQTPPLADRARRLRHVGLILSPHGLGRLFIAPLHVVDDAREDGLVLPYTEAAFVRHGDLIPCTVHQHAIGLFRQVLDRRIHAEMVLIRKDPQQSAGETILLFDRAPARDSDRAIHQGQFPVRNDQVLVELHLAADAGACRAGAEGIVEREHARLQFFDADTAVRAGQVLAEHLLLFAADVDHGQTVGQFQHCF